MKARNRKMVKNILEKGMTQTKAYADSRGHDITKPLPKHASSEASKLLSQPEIQALMTQMRQTYLEKAPEAARKQWELAEDEATPPHVKNQIYSEFQDRAGLKSPDITLGKIQHEHKYPEFLKSKEEIIEILNEPEKAEEITKRNAR